MKKISFTGDLMSLLPQNKAASKRGEFDYTPVFREIAKTLKASDYVVGNLETPIGGENLGWTCDDTVFNTPVQFVEAAVSAGFNCFSLANNHCLDRGIEGLNKTIEVLNERGIDHTGAYLTKEESEEILIKSIGNTKIAILNLTYGTNSEWRNNKLAPTDQFRLDLLREQDDFNNIRQSPFVSKIKKCVKYLLPQHIREKIKPIVIDDCAKEQNEFIKSGYFYNRIVGKVAKAKEQADKVVMLLHCGGQYNSKVGEYTRNVCRSLVALGCDLVVVNHPHCVLPFEYVDDKLVLYSLGNFCFTPNYGYYYKGVYADYSLIFNWYIDEDNQQLTKSVTVCKTVKEKSGHSVVYPVDELIAKSKGKQRVRLADDNLAVLKRFFGSEIRIPKPLQGEYFF